MNERENKNLVITILMKNAQIPTFFVIKMSRKIGCLLFIVNMLALLILFWYTYLVNSWVYIQIQEINFFFIVQPLDKVSLS